MTPDPTRPVPRWLRLGLAALLGAVAGATLFPTKAKGRAGERRN